MLDNVNKDDAYYTQLPERYPGRIRPLTPTGAQRCAGPRTAPAGLGGSFDDVSAIRKGPRTEVSVKILKVPAHLPQSCRINHLT